jgi:hypothetical protein
VLRFSPLPIYRVFPVCYVVRYFAISGSPCIFDVLWIYLHALCTGISVIKICIIWEQIYAFPRCTFSPNCICVLFFSFLCRWYYHAQRFAPIGNNTTKLIQHQWPSVCTPRNEWRFERKDWSKSCQKCWNQFFDPPNNRSNRFSIKYSILYFDEKYPDNVTLRELQLFQRFFFKNILELVTL